MKIWHSEFFWTGVLIMGMLASCSIPPLTLQISMRPIFASMDHYRSHLPLEGAYNVSFSHIDHLLDECGPGTSSVEALAKKTTSEAEKSAVWNRASSKAMRKCLRARGLPVECIHGVSFVEGSIRIQGNNDIWVDLICKAKPSDPDVVPPFVPD